MPQYKLTQHFRRRIYIFFSVTINFFLKLHFLFSYLSETVSIVKTIGQLFLHLSCLFLLELSLLLRTVINQGLIITIWSLTRDSIIYFTNYPNHPDFPNRKKLNSP